LIKRGAISSDDSVHTTLSLSRTRRPPGCLPAVIESSIINHVCMVRHQSVTDCDATYLFSGVILILVPEQLKLTLLVVVFSQDETSYLINLKQRGFVSSQLVYCSTFHHLILRSFNLSTLNTPLADLPNSTRSFHCRVGANSIFRVSGFEVKAQFHTHPSLPALRPYGKRSFDTQVFIKSILHSRYYCGLCSHHIDNAIIIFTRSGDSTSGLRIQFRGRKL
jgi:hypothetical protein